MKFSTRLKILIILAAVFAVCLIAGCSIGDLTKEQYLKNNDAKNQLVTYFVNSNKNLDKSEKATVNKKDGVESYDIYYKAESPIISTADSPQFTVERSNYLFNAWYFIDRVDENGNPYYDSEGDVMYATREVLPSDKIHANEHLYAVATWRRDIAIDIYLASDFNLLDSNGNVIVDASSEEPILTVDFGNVKPGQNFGLSESIIKKDNVRVNPANATFLSFFEDEECKKPITSIKMPGAEQEENVKVYVKYIEGKWEIVRTASDVASMLSGQGGKYYLYSSTGEINCSNIKTLSLKTGDYNIEIEGNGTVLSNLTFTRMNLDSATVCAPFGKLTATSFIRNLTLKNVTVEYSAGLTARPQVYLVLRGAEDSTSFENFVIDGITLSPNSQTSFDNLFNVQSGNYDYLLYGGYPNVTDAEFSAAHGGIEVKNVVIKIGENIVKELYKK